MILISACLVGINCKYNGENNLNKKIREIYRTQKSILVCPEQLGGLPTPRIPAEIKNKKVINRNKRDVSNNFLKGSNEAIKIASLKNCKIAILKSKSPSCGSNKIYDGTFSGKLINGEGIFAKACKKNKIRIISSENEREIAKLLKKI